MLEQRYPRVNLCLIYLRENFMNYRRKGVVRTIAFSLIMLSFYAEYKYLLKRGRDVSRIILFIVV